MKIEPIDSSIMKEDSILLIGQNTLIKFNQKKPSVDMSEDTISKLLSLEDLCTSEKKEAIRRILKIDFEILGLVQKYQGFRDVGTYVNVSEITKYLKEFDASNFLKGYLTNKYSEMTVTPSELRESDFLKDISHGKWKQEDYKKLASDINKSSKKKLADGLKEELKVLDEQIRNEALVIAGDDKDIQILQPSTLFLCPDCDVFLLTASEKGSKPKGKGTCLQVGEFCGEVICPSCSKIFHRGSARRFEIHFLKDNVRQLLINDKWFEEFIAKQIRKHGWDKVWTGCYVMGSSGATHEIDILAVKDGHILTAECKSGGVIRQEVFTYWTKAMDIRSQFNILACIDIISERETRRFIKYSPGFLCLDNIGKMTPETVNKQLSSFIEKEE